MVRFILCGGLLACATFLAHASCLQGAWVFDDLPQIVSNDRVHRGFVIGDVLAPRFLGYMTLQWNYSLGGLEPFGYHLFNISIHVLAVLALWGVLREILVHRADHWPDSIQRRGEFLAFSIAALWAVHPITTQAVAYVVQRLEAMWSAAFLVGLFLYLRGSRRPKSSRPDLSAMRPFWKIATQSPLVWSIVLFWVGMGCKEPIVASLLAVPVCDRVFGGFQWSTWWQQRRLYYGVLFAPVVIAVPMVILPRLLENSATSSGGFFAQTITPWEYVSTQPEAVLMYVSKILWPSNQCFDYLWPPQQGVLLLALEWLAVGVPFAVTLSSFAWGRPWSFFSALFFLNISTTCLIPLIDVVVEHRVYLASAWLIALIAIGLMIGFDFVLGSLRIDSDSSPFGNRKLEWVPRVAMGLGVLIFGYLCFQRSRVYHSPLLLWEDVVKQAEWNYRARVNYADALREADRVKEAVEQCRTALTLDSFQRQPDFQKAKVYDALADCLSESGDLAGAVMAAEQAVALTPGGSDHLVRLASVYSEHRKWEQAKDALRRAIRNRPRKAELYQKLGLLLTHTESWQEAKGAFAAAQTLSGGRLPGLAVQLAQVNWMLGQKSEATESLDRVSDPAIRNQAWLELAQWLAKADRWDDYRFARQKGGASNDSPQTDRQQYRELILAGRYDQAASLIARIESQAETTEDQIFWSVESATLDFRRGNSAGAMESLERICREHSQSGHAWAGLGDASRWSGQTENAIVCYEKAIELGHQDSATLNNLGSLLSPTRPTEAESYLRRAVELDPGNHQAWHSLGNTLVRQNRLKHAIDCYRRAIQIQPDFAPSIQTLKRIQAASSPSETPTS